MAYQVSDRTLAVLIYFSHLSTSSNCAPSCIIQPLQKLNIFLANFNPNSHSSKWALDQWGYILASNHYYKLVLTLLTMHLSDSKREFFAPRGGREICMVGPLSLNGNAAAADKVRAASNSNAVFCNGTFTTYDVRMGGGWGSGLAQKQTRVLIYCMSVMRTTGRGWKSLQKFGRHM